MNNRLQTAAGAMLALTLGGRAFALGTASYSSELISTRSLGEGATGVAGTQNDPIAVYTNPAAMTALPGTQATLGLTYVNDSAAYASGVASSGGLAQNYTQAALGARSGARATSVVVPNFAATTQFLDGKLAVGLAAVSPYGLETHFDGDSPLRYQSTDARLRIVDVTPSVAYKVDDLFSFGAGVDYYNTLEGDLEKKINVQGANYSISGGHDASPRADANSALTGNGDGWGYHLGTTIRPNERHQVGIVYHSAVNIGLSGQQKITGLSGTMASIFGGSDFIANVTAPLYMPQNLQIGYAYMPNERTQIEVDAAWYDFYAARQFGVVFSGLTSNQSAVLNDPASNPRAFNPRKTLNFGLGFDHKCTDDFEGRAGVAYEAASQPETAFDPAFSDLPRYALTAGASYKISRALSADFAYEAVFFHGRSINAPSALGSGYSGNFNNFANIISASLTYRAAAHL